ncbi:MAG: GNAT family N-acetyltransferase [Prevotella sp.]|jgi:predicted N-acetyltransferase YhbS/RimJ/RimL family protein N-acetyltransferase|nr:GNAT family N-acetyltransferase [Prevotella sp.]
MMVIETSRLRVIPLSLELFQCMLQDYTSMENRLNLAPSGYLFDNDMRRAMEYMYSKALEHPDEYIWHTNWQIILKSENRSIGSAGFKNVPDENGFVEVGYGIHGAYEANGYMTEALSALCRWAFGQSDVKGVIAETLKDNEASQRVLCKTGFTRYQETETAFWWRKTYNKTMKIRQETDKDYPEIYDLIKTAFETAQVKDGDEQDFALRLRNSKRYIPQLALVAEEGGVLIGHIMLTHTYVEQPDGRKFGALLVAPLSVLLEYRSRGVGSALMNEALRIARDMDYTAVFLCGDPGYYGRFGFVASARYGIVNVNNVPEQYMLAYELFPDALEDVSGTINCV